MVEKFLSPEERAEIEKLGFDKLMETLRQRLAEQKGRHQGGSKWIGTGGTSPFGAYGDHPEGVRIGQDKGRRGSAVKVWDKREFKDFDGDAELGPRNIKLALRRLRRFAREGAADELDLDGTIRSTADKGFIDVKLRPERRNAVKVLLFLDVGGSMDWHVEAAEHLFSAAQSQFKRLEHFYFHNCLYESVWKNNRRRYEERIATRDLINAYGRDYRVVFVGDASMSPYEIVSPGGSVEHLNPEPGQSLAGKGDRDLAAHSLDQPDPGAALGLFAVDPDHRPDFPAPHVRPDARRRRSGDEGAGRLRPNRGGGARLHRRSGRRSFAPGAGADNSSSSPGRVRPTTRAATPSAHHQHRALRVTNDRLGVGAEQIVAHHRTVRADDDEIGVPV